MATYSFTKDNGESINVDPDIHLEPWGDGIAVHDKTVQDESGVTTIPVTATLATGFGATSKELKKHEELKGRASISVIVYVHDETKGVLADRYGLSEGEVSRLLGELVRWSLTHR